MPQAMPARYPACPVRPLADPTRSQAETARAQASGQADDGWTQDLSILKDFVSYLGCCPASLQELDEPKACLAGLAQGLAGWVQGLAGWT